MVLLYYGHCLVRLRSDFTEAVKALTAAHRAFEQRGDGVGLFSTLAEWVTLCALRREPSEGLRIAEEALVAASQAPLTHAVLLAGMALCLSGIEHFDDAEAAISAARVRLDGDTTAAARAVRGEIGLIAAVIARDRGDLRAANAAAQQALAEVQDDAGYGLEAWVRYVLGALAWRQGSFVEASAQLDTARQLAEKQGHRGLWCWVVAIQGHLLRDIGELTAAREAYRLAEYWGEEDYAPVLLFVREGQLAEARWGCQALASIAAQRDAPIIAADAQLLLALIDLRTGAPTYAFEHADAACSYYAQHGYNFRFASALLYRSAAAIMLEAYADADADLAQALRILAAEDAYNCEWWLPDIIETLLVRAVQYKIEPAYARRMLNQRFLNALPPLATLGLNRPSTAQHSIELEIARQAQLALLPLAPPLIPHLDMAALSLPAEIVGGDFYGYYPTEIEHNQMRFGVALGDISGKGLPAALLTSGTILAVASAAVDNPAPNVLLKRVQSAVQLLTARSQQTVALCYLTCERQGEGWHVSASNAGSIAPLIRRSNGCTEWLNAFGLPLGVALMAEPGCVGTTLERGDVLVLVSDGVIEAMDLERELFGFEGFEESVRYAPVAQGARAVVAHLLNSVQAHTTSAFQHDDLTIVVVLVP
ncbi:SpoIIE family protein phosphatase [Candidatus Gracilibacteria bacterium]|nr:SpoIIE family protein phosphatase [Candidatus Gracilibacteria bacterium]